MVTLQIIEFGFSLPDLATCDPVAFITGFTPLVGIPIDSTFNVKQGKNAIPIWPLLNNVVCQILECILKSSDHAK